MKKWKVIMFAALPKKTEATTLYEGTRFNTAYRQFNKIKNAYALAEGFDEVKQIMYSRNSREFAVDTYFKGNFCSKNVIQLILEKD